MEIGTHDTREPREPHSFGVMPEILAARGDRGWLDDRGVDTARQDRVSDLYAKMDAYARDVRQHVAQGQPDRMIADAVALSTAWLKIRGEVSE